MLFYKLRFDSDELINVITNGISVCSFGIDSSGSLGQLSDTLKSYIQIKSFATDNEIVPLSVTGEDNCLLQAFVCREMVWHPLHDVLKRHLIEKKEWYVQRVKELATDSACSNDDKPTQKLFPVYRWSLQ